MTTPTPLHMQDPQYVSSSQAAALMGVHRDTIRRWADKGLVPSVRTPTGHRRFRVSDLSDAMRRTA